MRDNAPAPISKDLRGATAVVTGAAQGLGYAVAKAYVQQGMRVVIIDVQREKLDAAAQTINADTKQSGGECGECYALVADLTDAADTQRAIEAAVEHYGVPRVLVHNAAILNLRPLADLSFAEWQLTLNVGVQAAFLLTKHIWQPLTAAGGGSIVYVSSRSGIEGFAEESAYCATKHAMEGLMKSLALEGKARNISVNTVTPGMYMHTPMSERNYDEKAKQQWVDPMVLTPAFVALARQDANGITGQRLSAWELSRQSSDE
jgi:NAD(P)-dependent dehydrogenase (short-subunit alcohol dehydrogenase family)